MAGLYIWALLILFIVICTCPGFLSFLFTMFAVVVGVYIVYLYISDLIEKRREARGAQAGSSQDREKALDEWEKKWRRKHPTRE